MRRNWCQEVLGYQEAGLGVGAKEKEHRGPRRYWGAIKNVPVGSFVVPGSVLCQEGKGPLPLPRGPASSLLILEDPALPADVYMSIHIQQEDKVVGRSCFNVDPAQPSHQ